MLSFREWLNEQDLNESAKLISEPYKDKALETKLNVTKDIPNPHDFNTLYVYKEGNRLYFLTNKDYLNVIDLCMNVVGSTTCVGFFVKQLTKNNTLKQKEQNLWYIQASEFKHVITSQSDAEKFNKEVVKAVEGMRVKSQADGLRVYEKIDKIFKSYEK